MKSNRIVSFFVLLFAFFLSGKFLFSEGERREWTSNGVTVIGAWDPSRDTAEERITLESSDGKQQTLSLKDLSEEDRAYVEAKRKEIGWEPIPDPGAQNIYALLVGVTDYVNYKPLEYTVNDMGRLREHLLSMNVPSEHITMLVSDAGKERNRPSKSNIERELNTLLGSADGGSTVPPRVKKGDVVFIALSGHGTQTPGGAYFMPSDASETASEIEPTSISIEELQNRMSGSPATFKWLLVDACRSEPPRLLGHEGEKNRSDDALNKLQTISAPPAGMVTMQSCSANESSWESESLHQGIFTSTFIDGLKGGADLNKDGSVTMFELAGYLTEETPRRVRTEKPLESQTPYISNHLNNFVIVDGLLRYGLSREVWSEADACFVRSRQYRRDRRYEEAKSEIDRALSLTSGADPPTCTERQEYLDEEGVISELRAKSAVEEGSRLYSESVALVSQGKYDEALQKIEGALSLFPEKKEYLDYKERILSLKDAQSHYESAYKAYESGDYAEASELIEKALAIDPVNAAYLLLKRLIDSGPKPDAAPEPDLVPAPLAERVSKLGIGTAPGEKKTITVNGVDYTFCWCPAGEFEMGSPESEKDRGALETQHRVTLTRGFWLLENELTQEQWQSVMGSGKDGDLSEYAGKGPCYPMHNVDWAESVDFCRKLSGLTGEQVQLPTEAQWEYACRAGTRGAYGGTGRLNEMGWYKDNSGDKLHEVKGKQPNAWGLYDMHGNAWEWCSDWYEMRYYTDSPSADPAGPSSGSGRFIRGGSCCDSAGLCRSAYRSDYSPSDRYCYLGFRPAVVPAD